ncbi:hypothetical protein BN961_00383 [Afipia felis]|uniref:Uncharacterized protein n=1 Tax=Afipia felis TaxID=1035 RepID=A0A090ML18_AFIFE|nr:hypothetical protein [Afipia felis]CEG07002.1 hypothetical protein BN961_00383 [Afipia felis]
MSAADSFDHGNPAIDVAGFLETFFQRADALGQEVDRASYPGESDRKPAKQNKGIEEAPSDIVGSIVIHSFPGLECRQVVVDPSSGGIGFKNLSVAALIEARAASICSCVTLLP